MPPLVLLPDQPTGVPWPTETWPIGPLPAGVELAGLLDTAFDPDGPLAQTYAVVVVHRGRLVFERYAGHLPRSGGQGRAVTAETPLLSWSVAKSVLHAAVGVLVGDGRLEIDRPADVPEWGAADDPRHAVTLRHLLEMRDGLAFAEEYEDADRSDVIPMLFGRGRADVAAFAADRPLAAPPGERFNYSSGTSNIVAGVVARRVGPGERCRDFLGERLFGPIGMSSATVTMDDAGTWIASSFLYATARDFARFGLLYLRDGVWDGVRLLPEGWVDAGRTPRSIDPDGDGRFGRHWWTDAEATGRFWAAGHHGQFVDVVPALDLVLVRLGRTPTDRLPAVRAWRSSVVGAMADLG